MNQSGSSRSFSKSWGAEIIGDGRVRFRLWSPNEQSLGIRLGETVSPMISASDGWFEFVAEGVSAGSSYSFILEDGLDIPDPASRGQAEDVHGPSRIVDPAGYRWRQAGWRGRAWEEAVIYEMHVGTFTSEGTFRAATERLPHLAELGVTAVEIMPVAQFSGNRGWGYDGVLLYAPHNAYGSPEDMKSFIDAAHGLGLMVLLDVVYNHFGPDGNYLPRLAPDFFHPERHTPWGAAIAYEKEPVREFFIENALYWLDEYFLDGLRLDAIDHIDDATSEKPILVELAERVRAAFPDRPVHLTTEDNRNITSLHERDEGGSVPLHTAEWNDDFHNVAHVVATGESEGYYKDFAEDHWQKLARALAEGFVYQGEVSPGSGKARGAPSTHMPPQAFVDFLQNHDQIGNRAFGERLLTLAEKDKVRVMMAMLLLSPHVPLLFMGEEWGEVRPFCFFTDFAGELADAVRNGRRREFAGFAAFAGGAASVDHIPDPNAVGTFEASRIDWDRARSDDGREWVDFTGTLLKLRQEIIVPLLKQPGGGAGRILAVEDGAVAVEWQLGGDRLGMFVNLSDHPCAFSDLGGEVIYASSSEGEGRLPDGGELPAMSISVTLRRKEASAT